MTRTAALLASALLFAACDQPGEPAPDDMLEQGREQETSQPEALGVDALELCYLQCESDTLGCYDDVIAEGGVFACDPFGEISDCRQVRGDCRSTCETGLPGAPDEMGE